MNLLIFKIKVEANSEFEAALLNETTFLHLYNVSSKHIMDEQTTLENFDITGFGVDKNLIFFGLIKIELVHS
jgi:hypothetical protein